MSTTQLVTISNTKIPLVMYQGKPVVTFAMIDQVHQRPEGTARKRFADNRERFIEGKHFYVIDSKGLSVLRTEFPGVFGANAPQATVILENGYLKLVKTFTDDLAWDVQEQLVDGYFRSREPQKPLSLVEQALIAAKALFEQDQRLTTVETTLATIQDSLPKPSTHATVKSYAISKGYVVDNKLASQLGRKCAMLCRQSGTMMPLVPDEQYSAVNSYPLNILKLAFDEIMPDGVPKQKYVLEPEGDFYPVKELGYAVGRMRVNERGINRYLDCHMGWQYQGPDGRWYPTDIGKPYCKIAQNGKLLWNIEAFKAEYSKTQLPTLN